MKILILLTGFVLGIGITLIGVKMFMPKMMLTVQKSNLDFDQTVDHIEQSALEKGWRVPKIYDLQKSLAEDGYTTDIRKLKVVSLCQPEHAHKILSSDERKKVTAMMPCRVGVYETASGEVMISAMNIGLMSKLFGGVIEDVMGQVATEEHEMLKPVLAN
jgi:uncharacterized protein (DUF302 family)